MKGIKWTRGRNGEERLWIPQDVLEAIAEDELRKSGLMPTEREPAVPIDLFIERHLRHRIRKLDQYADLPAEVLGLTDFTSGSLPTISINRALSEAADEGTAPRALERLRTTMAHEAAHVLLHSALFAVDNDQASLPGMMSATDRARPLEQCLTRQETLNLRTGSDWKEVQANMGMAALLMPRSIFRAVAMREIASLFPGRASISADSDEARFLAARLTTPFVVSRQAALIRLQTLNIVITEGQTVSSWAREA